MRSTAIGVPPSAAAASRMPATSSAVVPSGDDVPTTPGPIATIVASAWAAWRARARADGTDTASRSTTEGMAGGDRDVDETGPGDGMHEVGDGDRQGGAVGHDVGEARVRVGVLDGRRHAGHLAVQASHDHRHAAQVGVGRDAVLLGGAGVHLEARVAELHDVARTGVLEHLACGVPVDDVPPAGAEAELDGRGVEHDAVTDRDRAHQLRERVGAPEVGVDALQTGPLLEQPVTVAVRNVGTYNEAMSFSTRSSRERKGSLQRTVRWAWSLSFRCTQSTV